MHGMVAEYQRRTAKERSGDAQRRAVERGVCPFPNIPAGYRRGDDGVLTPHATEGPIVAEAFRMRAYGASVKAVRAYLAEHGIARSYSGVISLLQSPLMIGELRFGELVNESAHEPIVDRGVRSKVQRLTISKGRRGTSERLLARLGVLRCSSCGSRMVVGTTNNHGKGLYHFYRCTTNGDCTRKVTIGRRLPSEQSLSEYAQRWRTSRDEQVPRQMSATPRASSRTQSLLYAQPFRPSPALRTSQRHESGFESFANLAMTRRQG
jgi:hypothetical protein